MCRPLVVTIAPGYRMYIDPSDYDGKKIFTNRLQIEPLTDIFKRCIRTGDCVLDIGANIGFYTLLASSLVGPNGCVHAFEASPTIMRQLKRNVYISRCRNVLLHMEVVSDKCGVVEFHTAARGHLGLSSLRDLGKSTGKREVAPSVSVDSIVDTISSVKLAKIDVEGAELLVLRGMQNLITRDRPYVLLEVTDAYLRQLGANVAEVCDFFIAHGYALYRIESKGVKKISVAPVDQCNLFCVHQTANMPSGIALIH